MLELILALIGIAFLLAYLFSKMLLIMELKAKPNLDEAFGLYDVFNQKTAIFWGLIFFVCSIGTVILLMTFAVSTITNPPILNVTNISSGITVHETQVYAPAIVNGSQMLVSTYTNILTYVFMFMIVMGIVIPLAERVSYEAFKRKYKGEKPL